MRWPPETIGFAGPLKRLRHGDEIRRPAEKMVARRWDSPARGKDCGVAMGFAGPLKILRHGYEIRRHAESEVNVSALLVNIALPNVIEHIVWLKCIAGNKHFEQLLMDGGGGKVDNLALQLAIGHRAVGPAGGKIEAWLEEVERTV